MNGYEILWRPMEQTVNFA